MSSSAISTSKLCGTINTADFITGSENCPLLGYYGANSGKPLLAAVLNYWNHSFQEAWNIEIDFQNWFRAIYYFLSSNWTVDLSATNIIIWMFQNALNLYFKLCVSQSRSFIWRAFTQSHSVLNKLFLMSNFKSNSSRCFVTSNTNCRPRRSTAHLTTVVMWTACYITFVIFIYREPR